MCVVDCDVHGDGCPAISSTWMTCRVLVLSATLLNVISDFTCFYVFLLFQLEESCGARSLSPLIFGFLVGSYLQMTFLCLMFRSKYRELELQAFQYLTEADRLEQDYANQLGVVRQLQKTYDAAVHHARLLIVKANEAIEAANSVAGELRVARSVFIVS